jgi:hypothetical protein
MRFMVFPRRRNRPGLRCEAAAAHRAAGRYRAADADEGHRAGSRRCGRTRAARTLGWIGIASAPPAAGRFGLVGRTTFVFAFKRLVPKAGAAATRSVDGGSVGQERKSSLSAPRNAPLRTGRKPGAETALFHYHRYFFPGGDARTVSGFNRRPVLR